MMLAVSGFCCFLAILASLFARQHGKNVLLPCAIAFTAQWVLSAACWLPAPYAPYSIILRLTGAKIYAPEQWAVTDCILAAYVLTKAGEDWTGLSLFALLVAQNAMHLTFQLGGLDYPRYASYLNGIFICEIAVFLTAGAHGITEYVASRWSHGSRPNLRHRLVEMRERRRSSLKARDQ